MLSTRAIAQSTLETDESEQSTQDQLERVDTPAEDEETTIEQVTVTGSRIKRGEFSSSSPITVITSERSALAD